MKPASVKNLFVNLLIIMVLGLGLTLIFFYVYLPAETNHGETITVPSVVEADYADLENLLADKDLRYEVNDSIFDSRYPPLTVLRQFPKAGTKVKEGRKVFVTLNKHEVPTIPFPPFKDKSLTHVKAVMSNLDFKLGKIRVRTGPHFNLVLEIQYEGEPIEEGQLIPKGSKLDIIITDGYGRQKFNIANYFGLEFDEAEFSIKGSDLNLSPLNLPQNIDTTGKDMFVIRQDPLPGTEVTIGEYVELWLDEEIDSSFYYLLQMDTTRLKNRNIIPYLLDSIRTARENKGDSIQ